MKAGCSMFTIKLTYTSFISGKIKRYYLKRQFHTFHFAERIADRFNYLAVRDGKTIGENVAVVIKVRG